MGGSSNPLQYHSSIWSVPVLSGLSICITAPFFTHLCDFRIYSLSYGVTFLIWLCVGHPPTFAVCSKAVRLITKTILATEVPSLCRTQQQLNSFS